MHQKHRVSLLAAALLSAGLITTVPFTTASADDDKDGKRNYPAEFDKGRALPKADDRSAPSSTLSARAEKALAGGIVRGDKAVKALGTDLAKAASLNDMTGKELRDLLRSDPSTSLTPEGLVTYMEPIAETDEAAPDPILADPVEQLYPLENTFKLSSRPSSKRTIYLDFSTRVVKGTYWNTVKYTGDDGRTYSMFGSEITLAQYNTDGSGGYSDAELIEIQQIYRRVVEDFAIWDVNVTTQQPAGDKIYRVGTADQVYGMHVMITSDKRLPDRCKCGGIAILDAFDNPTNHAYYTPAFVAAGPNSSPHSVATATSHEVGHTLSLEHDGKGSATYYVGKLNPERNGGPQDDNDLWAPIMGAGYYNPIVHWSNGDYAGATNKENDINVISTHGLTKLADDIGATPKALPSGSFSQRATIGYGDNDAFKLVHPGGRLQLWALSGWDPFPDYTRDGKVDLLLAIDNAAGTRLATNKPLSDRLSTSLASGMDASLDLDLPAGTYTVRVRGEDRPAASTTSRKYSAYGSIGTYTLTNVAP